MSAKRAFLGARVSTVNQKDNTSLQGQIDAMREYCAKKGYIIVEEMQESHTGTDDERPSLQRVRELGRAKQIDVMVVYSIDRFMRDYTKAVITEHELSKLGVTVEYLNLPDADNAGYRITKSILQILADEEKKTITERLLKGKYDCVKTQRKVITSHPPFGYSFNDDKTNFVINEFEADIVRRIFDMAFEGLSSRKIAEVLTNEHIPTFSDLRNISFSTKKSGVGVWAGHTITKILHNRTYLGEFTLSGSDTATMPIPAIVTSETFIEVQHEVAARRLAPNNSNKHKFLLRGMLFCGNCGRPLSISYKKFADREYLYYMCPTVQSKRDYPEQCETPYLNASVVEKLVLQWVYEELPDKVKMLEAFMIYYNSKYDSSDDKREAIEELIKTRQTRIEREKEIYRNGLCSIQELKDNVGRLQSEIAGFESELASITEKKVEFPTAAEFDVYITRLKTEIDNVRRSNDFEKIKDLLKKILKLSGTVVTVKNVATNQTEIHLELQALLLGEASLLVLETESSQSFQNWQTFKIKHTIEL